MRGSEGGQASVELVALLPLVAVVAAGLWQGIVAGQAVWLAGGAARSAARAEAVRGAASEGARDALPAHLERGLRVRVTHGDVIVVVQIPSVFGGSLGAARATAHMEAQA